MTWQQHVIAAKKLRAEAERAVIGAPLLRQAEEHERQAARLLAEDKGGR